MHDDFQTVPRWAQDRPCNIGACSKRGTCEDPPCPLCDVSKETDIKVSNIVLVKKGKKSEALEPPFDFSAT